MDADKIKEFFILHVEKMVLVLIIIASGFLLFLGVNLPNFLETELPENLEANATRVKSEIDINHNDAIIPDRKPTFDILARTKELDTAVDPSSYKLDRTWEGNSQQSIVRRQDPMLIAARSLIVKPISTAIAIRGRTTDPTAYTLASLEPADPVEKVEKKPRRERRSRRRNAGGMEDEMMMDMMGGDEEEDFDPMEEMMGEMADMGGGSMGGPIRKFNSKFDFGLRPTATEDKQEPVPAVSVFIAGTAVVPHKELYEAYDLALKNASEYEARRDRPLYYNLEVQRADVTNKPVDQLTEDDWSATVQTASKRALWDRELYTKLGAARWSGFAPEIVPEDYRDEALTTWIPPVLLDDYTTFALHPMVPMISQDELKKLEDVDDEEESFMEFDLEDTSVSLAAPGGAGGPGMGMDMDMDMGFDMMEMEMMGDMDGMMMGLGMGMFGRGPETDPVDYKLIRFYDFANLTPNGPKAGRKYVYRVRYSVNDPNFPFLQTLQPRANSLSPEVMNRVQTLMDDARKKKSRNFERWSEWSEPSEPVSLPTLEHYYVGPIKSGTVNMWQVGGKEVEYARDLPSAKIIASQYDMATGGRIPFQLDVTEGAVLSHKAESADVVDPITLEVKKLPDAEIVSGTTVVDIAGGAPLKISPDSKEELKRPGMMLLYDATGKLIVSSETQDQEFYRIYSYAEERGE